MHKKGLDKIFSKMFMNSPWVARMSIFLAILLYPISKVLRLKKSYISFKMQSKWNIFPVRSHFSFLWTPKKTWLLLIFILIFYLIITIFTLHKFIIYTIDNIWHNSSLLPLKTLSSLGFPQKSTLSIFLLEWPILRLLSSNINCWNAP